MGVEKFKIYFIDNHFIENPDCTITNPANTIVLSAHLEDTVVMHFTFNNLEIEYIGSVGNFEPIKIWQVKDRAHLEWVQLKWG